jgi:hypothetical protein
MDEMRAVATVCCGAAPVVVAAAVVALRVALKQGAVRRAVEAIAEREAET